MWIDGVDVDSRLWFSYDSVLSHFSLPVPWDHQHAFIRWLAQCCGTKRDKRDGGWLKLGDQLLSLRRGLPYPKFP